MRLIDADAELAKDKRDYEKIKTLCNDDWEIDIAHEAITNMLLAAPTVDAEPVRHGRWEHKIQEIGIFRHHYIACPHCNGWFNVANVHLLIGDGKLFERCPNCGAKMDGGEDVE